jgi:2-dehydro-3-deoxyphosphogalactonate aldolase
VTALAAFDAAFETSPLIAILRGIKPSEAADIALRLHAAGFRLIEVPLNSPDPFDSIARIVSALGDRAIVGAGTVTSAAEVRELAGIGAQIVLSPHFDADVVEATVASGMVSVPGVMSPTEAYGALKAGAHALKLFPMEIIGAAGVKALRAVLPRGARTIGVGGIDESNMAGLKKAGCNGFGLGSTLYKPGDSPDHVAARAAALQAASR